MFKSIVKVKVKLTCWTNESEMKRVEKENDIFLTNVVRELNLYFINFLQSYEIWDFIYNQ